MASEVRTIGINGAEYVFHRDLPEKARKVGDRNLAAIWVASLTSGFENVTTATVNEFDDGIIYGPSSIPGVFSDFAGACAAEVTVRWLEMAAGSLAAKLRRQRDTAMAAAGAVVAIAVVIISFLK
jgi:hypothetical protein